MLHHRAEAKAGKHLLIDQGEYSDYHVMGLFIIEKDFIPSDILEEYLGINPKNREDYEFEPYRFVSYLTTNGYIREISYDTFFLAGYGIVDEIEYRPPIPEEHSNE